MGFIHLTLPPCKDNCVQSMHIGSFTGLLRNSECQQKNARRRTESFAEWMRGKHTMHTSLILNLIQLVMKIATGTGVGQGRWKTICVQKVTVVAESWVSYLCNKLNRYQISLKLHTDQLVKTWETISRKDQNIQSESVKALIYHQIICWTLHKSVVSEWNEVKCI